jgi:3-hydroxyisobutyrate dehydrogenase-like beta-hydroxyacid dehydrogenase
MSHRTRKSVGLIGLGIIGSRVAENLRKKGFHVFVWNRTPRPVPNFVGAPSEVAELCDFIQIFVSDDEALFEICRQLVPALSSRHLVIAHATVSPYTMREAANMVERRGGRFIEAPFTGSKEAAEKGKLLFYVGGDQVAIQEARPILNANGEVMLIGEIGQATAIKIATNMITAASVQAAAEALALIYTAGLPLEKLAEAMRGNASYSKTLEMKLPKMTETNFDPHFSIKHMLKDVQIATRMASSAHLELTVTTAARDRLLEQMQHGRGDEDYSALARKYFADMRSAAPEEPAFELLHAAVEPEAAVTEPLSEPPPVDEASNFVSVVQEIVPQEPAPDAEVSAPTPEFTPFPAISEDRKSQSSDQTSGSEQKQDLLEDAEDHSVRRFFSRLLNRDRDY